MTAFGVPVQASGNGVPVYVTNPPTSYVSSIIAGANVTISSTGPGGTGDVTVNASGGGGGQWTAGNVTALSSGLSIVGTTLTLTAVTSAVAGNGVAVSAATGAVTFSAVINGATLSLSGSGLSINLAHANTWTGNQTFGNANGPFLLGSSSGYTQLLSANASATNYTITIPAVTDTLAVLGTAQTFTAEQTFSANPEILGSSTGGTVLASAETGSADHTQTFPAKSGTVADISDIPAAATTVVGPDAFGAAAAVGTGTSYARNDHDHGLPAALASSTIAVTSFTTTSATAKMAGLKGSITPTRTGTILVAIRGVITMPAVSGFAAIINDIYYSTGAAPNHNDALTGTAATSARIEFDTGTVTGAEALAIPFTIHALITGLSVGTAYWIDVAPRGSGANSWTTSQVYGTIIEVG